jgi:hypothetical protein
MSKSNAKKVSLRAVILLGIGLLLAGYVVGSMFPAPLFGDEGFIGAMRRPGSNNHRR